MSCWAWKLVIFKGNWVSKWFSLVHLFRRRKIKVGYEHKQTRLAYCSQIMSFVIGWDFFLGQQIEIFFFIFGLNCWDFLNWTCKPKLTGLTFLMAQNLHFGKSFGRLDHVFSNSIWGALNDAHKSHLIPLPFEQKKEQKITPLPYALSEWLSFHPKCGCDENFTTVDPKKKNFTIVNGCLISNSNPSTISILFWPKS